MKATDKVLFKIKSIKFVVKGHWDQELECYVYSLLPPQIWKMVLKNGINENKQKTVL